ncbi:unnamed protein product [Rotaria sp. Silwood1]|nr:unnamed protein product [Rotaria sp. Silwood1]CAF4886879.1 unnamed protein product [Rotaria sp. Silwood1]
MHSEHTTDLSILYSNLKSHPTNQEYVVLIKTGSLNPVHRCHISNMVRTKEYLEQVHNFNVIGGYISPTHDEYVHGKLRNELISGQHRIEMCRKAIEEAGQQHWLSVDMAECMGQTFFLLAPGFINLKRVTYSLQTFINGKLNLSKPVRVIYVAGLDLFNRCNGMNGMRKPPMDDVAVVYRPSQDDSFVRSTHVQVDSNVFYVCANDDDLDASSSDMDDISSTLIRERYKNNQDCEHLTYKSVLDHMKIISPKKN